MESILKDCLNVNVSWKKLAGRTTAGTPTYDEAVILKCYLAAGDVLNFGNDQELITAETVLYFDETGIEIKKGDLIIPPDNIGLPVIKALSHYDIEAPGAFYMREVRL